MQQGTCPDQTVIHFYQSATILVASTLESSANADLICEVLHVKSTAQKTMLAASAATMEHVTFMDPANAILALKETIASLAF